jgi:hypothetical protein
MSLATTLRLPCKTSTLCCKLSSGIRIHRFDLTVRIRLDINLRINRLIFASHQHQERRRDT